MSMRPFNLSVDLLSAGAILGTFMGYLPALAALGAVIWYGVQIWESKTVQTQARLWKARARAKRLAGLTVATAQIKARIADVEATSDKPGT